MTTIGKVRTGDKLNDRTVISDYDPDGALTGIKFARPGLTCQLHLNF